MKRGSEVATRASYRTTVSDAGGRHATWFPRSVPHALHAVEPAAGRRLNDPGMITCEALQPNRRSAGRLSRVVRRGSENPSTILNIQTMSPKLSYHVNYYMLRISL